jgi:hypothetical protein
VNVARRDLQGVVDAKDRELMLLRSEMEIRTNELTSSMRDMHSMIRQQQEQLRQNEQRHLQQQHASRQEHALQQQASRHEHVLHQQQASRHPQHASRQEQQFKGGVQQRYNEFAHSAATVVHFGILPSSKMPSNGESSRFENVDSDDDKADDRCDVGLQEKNRGLKNASASASAAGTGSSVTSSAGPKGAANASASAKGAANASVIESVVDGDGDAETDDITTGGNGDRESTVDETADAENSDSDGDHIRHIVISGDGGLRKKKSVGAAAIALHL